MIPEKYAQLHPIVYRISPEAFIFALLGAPLFVTIAICIPFGIVGLGVIAMVGIGALVYGAIPYFAIGTPTLIWATRRFQPAFMRYAWLGLGGQLVFMILATALAPLFGSFPDAVGMLGVYAVFGTIFAPLYAGTFGWLYAAWAPDTRILET